MFFVGLPRHRSRFYSRHVRFVDIIRAKRDGAELSAGQIQFVVDAVKHETVPTYQISAWLMAVFLQGMTAAESGLLTRAMTHSGDVLDLGHIPKRKVDKHSTGGVGDKVSICLAPAVAACGVSVPMVSGRGLGHTGGTLDKLESIAGIRTRLGTDEFIAILEKVGFVMGGQSGEIAPVDKTLYALRDVTGTVESMPLIASSIMSKKLAEGIDGLVLDVKVGSGAFMKTLDDARTLARMLVDLGAQVNVAVTAFLTDMGQPLGRAIGNACEMAEALEVMRGGGPSDLVEITEILGGEMCVHGGVADSFEAGRALIRKALNDGSAMDRMRQMVALQGGNPAVCDDFTLLPQPAHRIDVVADRGGFVSTFDTAAIGMAVVDMGGGRLVAEAEVDPAPGIDMLVNRGDRVETGQVMAIIGASKAAQLEAARSAVFGAITLSDTEPDRVPLVLDIVR
ncbi:MAG: pyrimidine-nucleoside phosphorylase [Myxococcota bacterium]|jgi:pyrimidine-nucleoside phosphorylase